MRKLDDLVSELVLLDLNDDRNVRVTVGELVKWSGEVQQQIEAKASQETEVSGLRQCLAIERHELAHATEQVKRLEGEVSRLRNLMHSMWTSTHTHAAEMERLTNAMNNE